jgi:hypothetical protein
MITALTASLALLAAASASPASRPANTHPHLVASPRAGLEPLRAHLRATLEGLESETWYCPAVTWEIEGVEGTTSTRESDCPAFDDREEFPRAWTRDYVLPAGDWSVLVTFSKAGKILGIVRETVRVIER